LLHLRDFPWRLCAIGCLVGTQANAGEQCVDVEAGFAHHFGDRRGVGTIRSRSIRGDDAGRGGKRHQHAGRGFDRSETGRELSALNLERQRTRRIQHHDLRHRRRIGERAQQIEQANALERDLAVPIELRVGRDQIVVTLELDGVAVVIDDGDRAGSGGVHLGKEFAEQSPHVARVDVGAFDDLEADAGERFGNQSAIGE
jgi:hypothetical protein